MPYLILILQLNYTTYKTPCQGVVKFSFIWYILSYSMAIIQSSKKAIRQNKTRRARNLVYINKMKNLLKDARALALQKKTKEAQELLPKVYEILDKAAKAGVIKKNTASRKKSRITKLIAKIK